MTVTVSTQGFRQMTAELAKISGKTHRDVIRAECGRVLETAMKWTGEANKTAYVRKRATRVMQGGLVDKNRSELHVNSGARGPQGRAWFSQYGGKIGHGYTHYIVRGPWGARPKNEPGRKKPKGSGPMKWPAQIWAKASSLLQQADKIIAEEEKEERKMREAIDKGRKRNDKSIKGRGLAKQSWLWIARSLGITLRGVTKKVAGAMPQDGKPRVSGTGQELTEKDTFYILLQNFYPFLIRGRSPKSGQGKFDGQRILERAIKSRVTAFAISLKKGVFNDLKLRASRYPALFSVS